VARPSAEEERNGVAQIAEMLSASDCGCSKQAASDNAAASGTPADNARFGRGSKRKKRETASV
jgi:hypothetical protein